MRNLLFTGRSGACALIFLMAASTRILGGDTFTSAISEDDLDVAACAAYADGKPAELDVELMLNVMGLRDSRNPNNGWSAGSVETGDMKGNVFRYKVAFKRPIPVGSLLFSTQEAAALKDDGRYPGDPERPEDWLPLDIPPFQSKVKLVTFDPGFRTRAFLFTDKLKGRGRSSLAPLRFFGRRLHNIAPDASAAASREYDAPEIFGGKLFSAADLVKGRGKWISAGKNAEGNINAPPISDLEPAWLSLSWPRQISVAGVWMEDNFTRIRLDLYCGPDNINPLVAMEKEWKPIGEGRVASALRNGRWLEFKEPTDVRALRLFTDKVTDARGNPLRSAEIGALVVFSDLGEAPAPSVADDTSRPPYHIDVEVPGDGMLTVSLDDLNGARVRNLIAREEVKGGTNRIPWDLRDDSGGIIPPGRYNWKAIWHPGLRLLYQFTVYPNISQLHPENTPWRNGMGGSGGWLADHSPPYGVCASGDRVYVGAPCPEAGDGFAACDISGRKLWSIFQFGPACGARRIAADGGRVFVEKMGTAYDDKGVEHVWLVDAEKRVFKDFIKRRGDEKRKVGIVGMAAGGNRLYLAIRAAEDFFAGATGEAAVDIARCIPGYKEKRPAKKNGEIVPDPRDDFLRLFRLKGDPPGYGKDHGLTYLESTLGPQRRQSIVLAFKEPVSIGCCILPVPQDAPYKVKLSFLNPDAAYPPNPERTGDWTDFEKQAELPWDIAVAPPNCSTRALLISFIKGDGDELSNMMEEQGRPAEEGGRELGMTEAKEENIGSGVDAKAWMGRIEGMKILRRRFTNSYKAAKVSVSSGKVDKDGVWVAERKEPLSAENPEYFMMEWDEARPLRGLAIKEIDCSLAEVDVWIGADGQALDMKGDIGWEKVGSYIPRRRMNHPNFGGHNAHARYMDGTVDFGREIKTRAVRIRVMEQWATETYEGSCARDLLGIDLARCRLFGVAPLQYVGGEKTFDSLMSERLEVWKTDGPHPSLEKELPLPEGGELALAPDGTLYAVSGKIVGKYDLASSAVQPLVKDLVSPRSMAFDSEGCLYVFDAAPERRNIRVYGRDGTFLRRIGEEGGYKPGPWNQNRLNCVTGLAVDREGKVWAADNTYWPKRVSVWNKDGKFLREYLGPAEYGGGGMLDPWDRSRMFYGPLEFELDWDNGTSRLKSLTWPPEDGWAAGDHPIHLNGRLYLATRIRPAGNTMPVGAVYIYDNQRIKLSAAMGFADQWKPLQACKFQKMLHGRTLQSLEFMWSDADEDGEVEPDEVRLEDRRISSLTRFNDDLSVQAGQWRYSVKSFLPGGTPVFEKKLLDLPPPSKSSGGGYFRLGSGAFFSIGWKAGEFDECRDSAGKVIWRYPSLGAGVGPNRTAGPYRPDQVVCEFGVIGNESAAAGDLGEYFVLNNNLGQWNVWTSDGLLASRIFRDNRDPRSVFWQMPRHERGMNLDNLSQFEETFNGCFVRMRDDGRCYAVAGKAEASIVEVQGMSEFRRYAGTAEVSRADLDEAGEWERGQARRRIQETVRVADAYRSNMPIKIDGILDEWAGMPSYRIGDGGSRFLLAYDSNSLYVAVEAKGAGPFCNAGGRWDICFKSGAAIDLQIGSDEAADPARQAPVEGDRRLLLAAVEGGPLAVLYDMIVPGVPQDKKWKVASPTGETVVDIVSKIDGVRIAARNIYAVPSAEEGFQGYGFEAQIPLDALGVKPCDGLRLKMDIGILEADRDGGTTVRRRYWANPLVQTVSDIPSEARIQPDMWGWIRFHDKIRGPAMMKPGDISNSGMSPEDKKLMGELDLD